MHTPAAPSRLTENLHLHSCLKRVRVSARWPALGRLGRCSAQPTLHLLQQHPQQMLPPTSPQNGCASPNFFFLPSLPPSSLCPPCTLLLSTRWSWEWGSLGDPRLATSWRKHPSSAQHHLQRLHWWGLLCLLTCTDMLS